MQIAISVYQQSLKILSLSQFKPWDQACVWCQYLDVPPISWEAHVTLECKCNNPVLDKTVWLSLRECSTEPHSCCCLFECQRYSNSYTNHHLKRIIDYLILYWIKSHSHVLFYNNSLTPESLKATIYTFPHVPVHQSATTAPGPAICRAPSPRMPSLPTPWPWWWQMNNACVWTYLMNVVKQKYERNNTSD